MPKVEFSDIRGTYALCFNVKNLFKFEIRGTYGCVTRLPPKYILCKIYIMCKKNYSATMIV